LDNNGNPILFGYTDGYSEFPIVNGLQISFDSPHCDFVSKFNQQGTSLIFSTLIGENGFPVSLLFEKFYDGKFITSANTMAIGPTNEIYLVANHCGNLDVAYYPTTLLAFANQSQSNYYDRNRDGIFMVLTAAGDAIKYSTLLTTTSIDIVSGIDVDDNNNVYIGGSNEGLILDGLLETTNGCYQDAQNLVKVEHVLF